MQVANYSIYRIGVDRKHTFKRLFPEYTDKIIEAADRNGIVLVNGRGLSVLRTE